MQRTTCRLCESKQLELAVPMRPCPIGDSFVPSNDLLREQRLYPMDLYLCMDCSHLQLPTVVNPRILFSDYIYTTSSSPGLVQHFEKYCDDVESKIRLDPGSFVFEIGSNDGTLLNFFKKKGHQVLGVDPAKAISEAATQSGVETLNHFFDDNLAARIRTERGSADLICANNVFAHADNMIGIVDGIASLLKPTGVFVFEVSYIVDLIERNVFDTIYHEHLCHHAIRPLDTFLSSHGMELFDVERNSSKGGTIRCFAQLKSGVRPKSPKVQEMKEAEISKGYQKLGIYAAFSKRLDKMREDIHVILDGMKSKGKKIEAFGASNPAMTILFHFGLEPYFSKIYDDNKKKQGLFSPRLHLPVVPSEQIYSDKPDCVFLLAWAYADRIAQKHEKYLSEVGGRFVVPIPDVRIIS